METLFLGTELPSTITESEACKSRVRALHPHERIVGDASFIRPEFNNAERVMRTVTHRLLVKLLA
jgi:hypothetical protein